MQYDYIVVDSHNLAYRQWWHVKDLSYNGVPTGLEYGFIKKVVGWLKSSPEKLHLAWDGRPSRCANLVSDYKSGRVKVNGDEPDWSVRLTRLREAFSGVCRTLYDENEEADEQIAKFVLRNPGKRILIVSNDKDLQQFISSNVHTDCSKGVMDAELCMKEWGVPPYKIALYKALDGDGSDNVKGVPRLLTKTKIKLVNMSDNIDELVGNFEHSELSVKEREKLALFRDQVLLNYKVVNLLSLEGEPRLTLPSGDRTGLEGLIRECNFTSITL
jgi:5'-3' exonuclease